RARYSSTQPPSCSSASWSMPRTGCWTRGSGTHERCASTPAERSGSGERGRATSDRLLHPVVDHLELLARRRVLVDVCEHAVPVAMKSEVGTVGKVADAARVAGRAALRPGERRLATYADAEPGENRSADRLYLVLEADLECPAVGAGLRHLDADLGTAAALSDIYGAVHERVSAVSCL